MSRTPGLVSGGAGREGTLAERALVNAGFHLVCRDRCHELVHAQPVRDQERVLSSLLRKARSTRFGRDHRFDLIRSVADFQRHVPIRTYEQLWDLYLRDRYPVFDDLTWPGRIPYLALTSGTTLGATKYIPVSREMLASNRKGAQTLLAYHMASRPDSRLFHGQMCFLGGTAALEEVAPGVYQGDLSGIAAVRLAPFLRPYVFPPVALALECDWDRKLSRLAEAANAQRITLAAGVPAWLLQLFDRVLKLSGATTIADAWPHLEVVVHGGVKLDPYRARLRSMLGSSRVRLQESYPCSEGFIGFGDPATGLLRLMHNHGIFYEFVPVSELESDRPARHWLGTALTGVNYAIIVSTCAGMWAHVIGDTVRFDSLDPPLFQFTGRTRYTLSAFGEHLTSEEVEGALAHATQATRSALREWHVGPVFAAPMGFHQFVVEFDDAPLALADFRDTLDADLGRRNADYLAHRAPGAGLFAPSIVCTRPGGFDAWMRERGKLGGQNKVPRMDSSGSLTRQLVGFLRASKQVSIELEPGAPATVQERVGLISTARS